MSGHGECPFSQRSSLALVVWLGLIFLFISECERASRAADPEFAIHSTTPDNPTFAGEEDRLSPSLSPDGRYTASYIPNSSEIVVRQRVDGKELFRIASEGKESGLLRPTFSQNSEFIAMHSVPMNSNQGTSGLVDQLIVHQCLGGRKLFEVNLSLHPEVILFSNDWLLVAGESPRHGGACCCQIIRSDNGSEVANLIISGGSGVLGTSMSSNKFELDDTHLHLHATNRHASFFGGTTANVHTTYSWNWKRVMELSQQGENIIAVGSRLSLVYKYNQKADPRAELTRLGAVVAPYIVLVHRDQARDGATYYSRSDAGSGEMYLGEEDPKGGLSINISDVALSDRELVGLLKRIPRVKELIFSHYQLMDLSQLSQINGLEGIQTRRKLRAADFAAIAKMLALRSLPSKVENDDALTYVVTMQKLESLSLATPDVTDTGVDRVSQMQSLKNVYLYETGISSQGLKTLETMPNLDSVDINFGLAADDQALKLLVGSQKIRKLVLGIYNQAPSQISDAGLKFIGGVANLESLDLNFIPITDVGVEHLLGLKKLRMLNLTGTKITNSALKSLGQLPLLANLDVSYCEKLNDVGMLQLQNIKSLRMLKVSYAGSGITTEGVAELRRLRPGMRVWTGTEF